MRHLCLTPLSHFAKAEAVNRTTCTNKAA